MSKKDTKHDVERHVPRWPAEDAPKSDGPTDPSTPGEIGYPPAEEQHGTGQPENPRQHTDVERLDQLRKEVSDPNNPPSEERRKELIDEIDRLEAPMQRKVPPGTV